MIFNKAVAAWLLGTVCLHKPVAAEDGALDGTMEGPMEGPKEETMDGTLDGTFKNRYVDHEQGTCKDVCKDIWCDCVIDCALLVGVINLEQNEIDDPNSMEEHEACMMHCEERNPDLFQKCGFLCGEIEFIDLFEYFGECDGNHTKNPSGSASPSANPSSPAPSTNPSSPAPSVNPSFTSTPTTSAAPTIECTCCDCTHTSGCHNDPHYRTWNNIWFDFQGACDQIAIDNHILQLQIRTRPRQWYSTVTEIGLLMKDTGETFHAQINLTNDIVVQSSLTAASGASYSSSSGDHKVTFFDGEDSYILIRRSGTGMSVSVKGQGHVFTDSEGMFGSWNYGGVRYSNGTTFDLSGGYWNVLERSIELAESWMVNPDDSLMDSPSTICDPSPQCGGADDIFDCNEIENRRRKLEVNPGCDKTCDDISNALLRESCEKDLELTGDPTWACEDDYVKPIIVESAECEFEKTDDSECYKEGDSCQRLGGFCKVDCESTVDHVCLPGLCSTRNEPWRFPGGLPEKIGEKFGGHKKKLKIKHSKAPIALKKKKKKNKCECFVPVKCT